jgi:taurine transport system ATP-binding protein
MTYKTGYTTVHALEHIRFTIKVGDFLVIVGPSGCGKTTLLNIIAGFLVPTEGQVTLNGKNIDRPGAERGVVFQRGALFPWLTVYENAEFGLRMRKVPKKERHKKTMEYLNLVGLSEFAHTSIYNLSGGMQQRVALVRCLVNDPAILLMDEPLGALDALTREKMQSFILKIWKETGKMILFITHSVEEAIYLASSLLVMSSRPGKIIKRYDLSFAREDIGSNSRAVKSSHEFIHVREEILSLIWSMEEEVVRKF